MHAFQITDSMETDRTALCTHASPCPERAPWVDVQRRADDGQLPFQTERPPCRRYRCQRRWAAVCRRIQVCAGLAQHLSRFELGSSCPRFLPAGAWARGACRHVCEMRMRHTYNGGHNQPLISAMSADCWEKSRTTEMYLHNVMYGVARLFWRDPCMSD